MWERIRKWQRWVVHLLRTGTSPERLALAISLGAVIGLFPLVGTTTLLCTVVALPLGLNLPVIQGANYLVTPVQLALVLPFIRIGERLFSVEQPFPMSPAELRALIEARGWRALGDLGIAGFHGAVAWLLVAPWIGLVAYLFLQRLLERKRRENGFIRRRLRRRVREEGQH